MLIYRIALPLNMVEETDIVEALLDDGSLSARDQNEAAESSADNVVQDIVKAWHSPVLG